MEGEGRPKIIIIVMALMRILCLNFINKVIFVILEEFADQNPILFKISDVLFENSKILYFKRKNLKLILRTIRLELSMP